MSDEYFSGSDPHDNSASSHQSDSETIRHFSTAGMPGSAPAMSSTELDRETHFPLMKLTPELRLSVYDSLFTDLTITRQRKVADLTTYHRYKDWPGNDLTDFRNLLLTCKAVHEEAKNLWEKKYARRCCFYFWKVPDLYRVYQQLVKLGEPYSCMKYALRTRPREEVDVYELGSLGGEAEEVMIHQPGFPDKYSIITFVWPKIDFSLGEGIHMWQPHGTMPYEIYNMGSRKRQRFVRADYPELKMCSIAFHERQSRRKKATRYMLMSGEIGNIGWDKFDAAAAHSRVKIWEEWKRKGHQSHFLEKADAVLTWRAKAMSGQDQEWLALGGNPESDLQDLEDMSWKYSLEHWLDPSF